jgi:hypothetical protein
VQRCGLSIPHRYHTAVGGGPDTLAHASGAIADYHSSAEYQIPPGDTTGLLGGMAACSVGRHQMPSRTVMGQNH